MSESKFSGTRKFTLRYLKFGTNFDFEISRGDAMFDERVIAGHMNY